MTPTHFSVGFMLENGERMTPPEGIWDIQGINLTIHLENSLIPCTRMLVCPEVISSGSSSGHTIVLLPKIFLNLKVSGSLLNWVMLKRSLDW
jgi:hypothetical protein